jgi:hypothetical protein
MTAGSQAAERVISELAAHWSRTRQLAAALARELAQRPEHSRLEPSTRTAARHGVSLNTALNARNLLVDAGLAYKHGPHYYTGSPAGDGAGR